MQTHLVHVFTELDIASDARTIRNRSNWPARGRPYPSTHLQARGLATAARTRIIAPMDVCGSGLCTAGVTQPTDTRRAAAASQRSPGVLCRRS